MSAETIRHAQYFITRITLCCFGDECCLLLHRKPIGVQYDMHFCLVADVRFMSFQEEDFVKWVLKLTHKTDSGTWNKQEAELAIHLSFTLL